MGTFAGAQGPEKERDYAAARLDGVITKIKTLCSTLWQKSSGR